MDNIVNRQPPDSGLNQLGEQTPADSPTYGDGALPTDPAEIARQNWRRYQYIKSRGHQDYLVEARRNENYYLGGGLQWPPEIKQYMEEVEMRPASEINLIMEAVDGAVGYQIANRMDAQFVPSDDDAKESTAKVLSIVAKNIFESTRYKWHETQAVTDGFIAQRGYINVRLGLTENMLGDLVFETIDPMDVIPDPDAKSYDPADWLDVTITRWLTKAEARDLYGPQVDEKIANLSIPRDGDFGDGDVDDGVWRNRFGDARTTANEFSPDVMDRSTIRYRFIDRQHHRYDWAWVAIYPSGDVVNIENVSQDEMNQLRVSGALLTKRRIKRVRWTVSAAQDVLILDQWSPWKTFTVVPFFPRFRRGRTRGLVDNAISPQDTLNKGVSQAIAVTNGTAQSGYFIEQNSLVNMTPEELEAKGAQNGLVIQYKQGSKEPKKIEPNQIPNGLKDIINLAAANIRETTGWTEALSGDNQRDLSGVAIQSHQFIAQQRLAMPLDNLARTRHMVTMKVLEFIQKYMSDERIIRIAPKDPSANAGSIVVNKVLPDGSILHDLTLGKYDCVVSDQPMQITFDNSQFEQIKAMAKEFGYKIPPSVALRYSNLPDKAEVAPILEQANSAPPNPKDQAEAALKNAQAGKAAADTELTKAKTVQTKATAVYSATQAAAQAAAMPHLAPVADEILDASGFEPSNGSEPFGPDADEPTGGPSTPVGPLSPGQVQQVTQEPGQEPASLRRMPKNTDPLTPAHPDRGVDHGIEGGQ